MQTDAAQPNGALEVEAFIASCRLDGPSGRLSRSVPDSEETPHTLYHASADLVPTMVDLQCTSCRQPG